MFAPNLHSSLTFTSSTWGATWISQGVEAVLDGLQTDVAANLGTLRSKEKSQCWKMLKVLAAEDSVDSSRFATRTARTQGIGQRGKKRAYLAQPKADWGQNWPFLALSWAEQEPTWAQLGRVRSNFGPTTPSVRADWFSLATQQKLKYATQNWHVGIAFPAQICGWTSMNLIDLALAPHLRCQATNQ